MEAGLKWSCHKRNFTRPPEVARVQPGKLKAKMRNGDGNHETQKERAILIGDAGRGVSRVQQGRYAEDAAGREGDGRSRAEDGRGRRGGHEKSCERCDG